MKQLILLLGLILGLHLTTTVAQPANTPGQRMLDSYFANRTAELRANCLTPYRSLADWQAARPELQRQLREMLGLDPWPERTELKPVITGILEQDTFRVEKLHFQSVPGLYVTANLYLPKHQSGPLPTILYVCGHAIVKEGDRSYGNKVAYQHHAIWFAENGYACLVIDTIHRGEIEGIHHGTYSYDMWWWNSRGYTSAGIEAWNCVRALDYLETRQEVDMDRIGITGRSGGGVYSWWTTAIDERINVAVPVAGITDLQNHVIDGTVEGHCDCMFMVNTYRWDYAQVAALIAPRPLLIANSDKDPIFPLDGVVRLHSQVRDIYRLHNADDQLGLLITEGPHKDTQDLRVPTFRWMNRFLKQSTAPIDSPAEKRFPNRALAVFDEFPTDAINTQIHETFVPSAPTPSLPPTPKAWTQRAETWRQQVRTKSFRSWPAAGRTPDLQRIVDRAIPEGTLQHFSASLAHRVQLPAYSFVPRNVEKITALRITVLDESTGSSFHEAFKRALDTRSPKPLGDFQTTQTAHVWIAPRGIGPTAWSSEKRHHTQVRRRFMLLGETLDSMRVFDIVRGVQSLIKIPSLRNLPKTLSAADHMAVNALYASQFLPEIDHLELTRLPAGHRSGPDYINVSRLGHLSEALAYSLADRSVTLIDPAAGVTTYAQQAHEHFQWQTTFAIEQSSAPPSDPTTF